MGMYPADLAYKIMSGSSSSMLVNSSSFLEHLTNWRLRALSKGPAFKYGVLVVLLEVEATALQGALGSHN